MTKYNSTFDGIYGTAFNKEAVINLAIKTAFLRNDWTNWTEIDEVDDFALKRVASKAEECCDWVGLHGVKISNEQIQLAIWGITSDYEEEN